MNALTHPIEQIKRIFRSTPAERPEVDAAEPSVETPAPGSPERVHGAAWLASDRLLLVVRHAAAAGERAIVTGPKGEPVDLDARLHRYDAERCLVLLSGLADASNDYSIELGSMRIPSEAIRRCACDLSTLVRENLAGLMPSVRLEIMAFIMSALAEATEDNPRLTDSLYLLREALRERLPYCVTQRDLPQGMHIDTLLAVDERSFYVKGWLWDGEADTTSLIAESPLGCRVELIDRIARYPRPDILNFYGGGAHGEEAGFLCYFQTVAPCTFPGGWIFEMHNSAGTAWQKKAPAVAEDLLAARDTILGDISFRDRRSDALLERHLYPAIDALQEQYRATITIEEVDQYGEPPADAEISIVVPLYKRIEFVEQQFAQFAHDDEVQAADLIYVLDSPEQADRLRDYALQLHRLYRFPFRVVTLNRNAGFSTANNIGASLARGRLLLLLNSDVLPDRPGWLETMASFYDAQPNIGALGPKLLYEDDSLQHAGMCFARQDGETEWENEHYFKGLHRRLPAANVARTVPAVTGACLMIDRALYQSMGGLHGSYVQGDYEDSDLCLRLSQAGYENWYCPDAELYHLEGQSYPSSLRHRAQVYNRWLHTYLWKDEIQAVMAESAPGFFPHVLS